MDSFLNILNDVMSKIFNKILRPVLETFLEDILNLLIDAVKKMFASLLYWLYTSLLKCIDFFVKIFDFFSGSEDVIYTASGSMERQSVLELFFKVGGIQKAFLIITCLAVGLSFIFTIYAVAKSISDMALEDKNPIGKVLGNALKCCFTFMLVPFLCIFALRISTIVLDGIDTALSVQMQSATGRQTAAPQAGNDVSLATILWLSSSMDAAKDDHYNISNGSGMASFWDSIRIGFYRGTSSWAYGEKAVEANFDYDKFSYGIGFVSCIFLIVMLMMSILLFIRRIFEIVILYLTSPLFVSTMPLDGGQMFGKWRDMFIAKFFSAFGCVFSIRLYVMFVPLFANGTINLYPKNAEISYFLLVIFLMGGAYAIYKSHHILLMLLHPDAAEAATQSAGAVLQAAKTAYGLTGTMKKSAKKAYAKQKN